MPFRAWVPYKVPQNGWLKTTESYSLIVWGPEIQNQYHCAEKKVWAGLHALQRLYRRIHSFSLPASGGRQHSLACGHVSKPLSALSSHPLLLCVYEISLCLPLTSEHTIAFRAQSGNPE